MLIHDILKLGTVVILLFPVGVAAVYLSHILAKVIHSVDIPDNVRKGHKIPTPSTGGIGIFATFIIGFFILHYMPVFDISERYLAFIPYLAVSMFLMAGTGLYDDLYGLSSKPKFTMQTIASVITIYGLDQTLIGAGTAYAEMSLAAKLLLYGLFLIWIVANCNAINLIDGVDGLAGLVTLSIIMGLVVIATYWAEYNTILILVPLAAAIVSFLIFNRPPASIFMGDTGSLLIGYILPVSAIIICLNCPHWSYNLIFVVIFGVPLLDTVTSILRRNRMGISVFESDNNHAHHIIQRKFKSPNVAVLVMVSISLLLQAFGLWMATIETVIGMFLSFGFIFMTATAFLVYYYINLMNKNSYFRVKYVNEAICNCSDEDFEVAKQDEIKSRTNKSKMATNNMTL